MGIFWYGFIYFNVNKTVPDVNGGKVEGTCSAGKEMNAGPYFVVLEGIFLSLQMSITPM